MANTWWHNLSFPSDLNFFFSRFGTYHTWFTYCQWRLAFLSGAGFFDIQFENLMVLFIFLYHGEKPHIYEASMEYHFSYTTRSNCFGFLDMLCPDLSLFETILYPRQ